MAATLPQQDVFTKITDPSEKEKIFRDLASARSEIVAKKPDSNSEIFLLSPFLLENFDLRCRLSGQTSPPIESQGSLIVTYLLGGEKYFHLVDYIRQNNELVLLNNYPVYYLQRREDFRIKMTSSYKVLLESSTINKIVLKRSLPIQDLSGGGCRIQMGSESPQLKIGDEISGHLFLPDRDPIEVTCIVKYSRFENSNKLKPVYGLQFSGMNKLTKNRIIALVLDLYRQFFAGRG